MLRKALLIAKIVKIKNKIGVNNLVTMYSLLKEFVAMVLKAKDLSFSSIIILANQTWKFSLHMPFHILTQNWKNL